MANRIKLAENIIKILVIHPRSGELLVIYCTEMFLLKMGSFRSNSVALEY